MGVQDEAEHLAPADAARWREWLETHHETVPGVWVAATRSGDGGVSYEDAVCEALCFGWVDGLTRSRADAPPELWFAPRRPGSAWARSNRDRVARLEAEGRMRAPGRRAVEVARANGRWSVLEGPEALEVPDDLAAAFGEAPTARTFFDALPPSARKAALAQVALARRPETRARRVALVVEACADGRRPAP